MTVLTGRRVLASLSAALVATALASGQPASANGPETVATGLDNPRGITVAPNGDIFVAEAGTGGLDTEDGGSGPCFPDPEGGDDPVCFGSTGAVTRIARGRGQERVITGLPSIASGGGGASGPTDVVMTGSQRLAVLIGLGAPPEVRDAAPAALHPMGTLQEYFLRQGRVTALADIAAQELANNAVDDSDSNPVGFVRDGSTYVVADAGGNTIVTAKHGETSTLAAFQDETVTGVPFPVQAVPTAVAIGPDRAYYMSQLTGYPFPEGASKIYRVTKSGDVSVYASGLTNVTDLAFAEDGTLYAVEIAEGGLLSGPFGALVRVPAGSSGPVVVADGLFAPYGLALSGHMAYVTTGSVGPGGEVVRISLS